MNQGMQVLVSVNSAAEAQLVLSAGVPLIDLKDTSHGALAALDIETSKMIIDIVHAHRQQFKISGIVVSATIGDSCTNAADLITLIERRLEVGVEVIKLPESIWAEPAYKVIIDGFLAQGIRLIAVLLPTSLIDSSLEKRLQSLAMQGYWGVMVDTVQKSSALVDMVAIPVLTKFISTAKSLHLIAGIAGGLALTHVEMLSTLNPDYLGFRSGVCEDGLRSQNLSAERVYQLVSKVSGKFVG
jgi:(5-formylfuran-3-yl)methyl phosphate synthase